uniref:PH domain-containing protein n=1 Tax=Globodera rostochiensis TaxID=31243 RepID=A0A914HH55_GLORO
MLRKSRNTGKGDTPVSPCPPKFPIPDFVKLNGKERKLATKVLELIRLKIPVNKDPPTGKKVETLSSDSSQSGGSAEGQTIVKSATLSAELRSKSRSFDDISIEYGTNELTRSTSGNCMFKTAATSTMPEVTEERVGLVVSKKGYMHFLEGARQEWVRRWVVIRRPYILLYRDDKDLVIRGIINLAIAKIEYNDEQQENAPNTFTVCTTHRAFFMQALPGDDLFDWIGALNPLLAGQIRSRKLTIIPKAIN